MYTECEPSISVFSSSLSPGSPITRLMYATSLQKAPVSLLKTPTKELSGSVNGG